MAKEKRSVSDLDAELAELEAELAALEGKPKKPKKAAPPPKAAPEPAAEPAPEPAQDGTPSKRSRFALPKLGKKKPEPAPEPVPAAEAAAPAEPAPEPAPAREPAYDASVWREEDGAWVRTVPETPVPVIRRVLDADGELVREEAASARDVDEARGVKAERGLGRLLRRK